ncbi:helix-turn-helix transcriptional regulator [Microbispora sp. NPDC046973]|uniref:helix-turn-helix domain-containing protein n=1 Tax=Microbispora sp. NPDC046973 TaxID=3155022 RepID=UPI0033D42958
MDSRTEIREFLTSRRARISPQQAGLPSYGTRRVPGLRRVEVAQLAGISVEYYSRLERGDLSGVSDSVLDTLARALRLDDEERTHLEDLARSDDFRARWARHDVRQHHIGTKPFRHPVVGDLHLTYEALDLTADNLTLVAYGAEPGSDSEDRLRLLASWASTLAPAPGHDPGHDGRRPPAPPVSRPLDAC